MTARRRTALLLIALALSGATAAADPPAKLNVIFVLSGDLAQVVQ